MTSLVVREVIGGGVLELERGQVTCPACGQQVEAVAADGRVKGYCAVTKQYVGFLIETQLAPQTAVNPVTAETRAKTSAGHTGSHHTAEARAKMSTVHTGKHLTAETKAKISASAKKRWQDSEYQAKKQSAAHKSPERQGVN